MNAPERAFKKKKIKKKKKKLTNNVFLYAVSTVAPDRQAPYQDYRPNEEHGGRNPPHPDGLQFQSDLARELLRQDPIQPLLRSHLHLHPGKHPGQTGCEGRQPEQQVVCEIPVPGPVCGRSENIGGGGGFEEATNPLQAPKETDKCAEAKNSHEQK